MISRRCRAIAAFLAAVICCALAAQSLPAQPASGAPRIDFHRQIHPILMRSCAKCHGGDAPAAGFRVDRRESFLAPAESGRAPAVRGKSAGSRILELLRGEAPAPFMPKEGPRLSPAEIGLIERWIDEGLDWTAPPADAPAQQSRPLALKKVELPPAVRASESGIDRLLRTWYEANNIAPPKPASDAVFARRVWLDANGLLPPPDELAAFEADASPGKRAALARRRLSDARAYAEHWITFWNDLLRNDFQGLGFLHANRRQMTPWLYEAIATNMPYDEFARRLVAPGPESDGFVFGIELAGSALPGETRPMQAAASVSQVFLGANLKCAACHDSFTNRWKLADAYGMGAIFSDAPLELSRCERALGRKAEARFLYPELGSIDPAAPKAERQKQLAALLTDPRNGLLPRTLVNRFWARLFGRGLVEPLEDQEAAPWNADLLDWMAGEFVARGYDMRWLLELMMTSEAYGAAGEPAGEGAAAPPFRARSFRRLQSEEFMDAIAQVTGDWPENPGVEVDLQAGVEPIEPRRAAIRSELAKGQWIWREAADPAAKAAFEKPVVYSASVELGGLKADPIESAQLAVYSDFWLEIKLNGKLVDAGQAFFFGPAVGIIVRDVRALLREGGNRLSIEAKPSGEGRPGIFAALWLKRRSGAQWAVSGPAWEWREASGAAARAVAVGEFASDRWNLAGDIESALFRRIYSAGREARAWRMAPDDLARALGRPTREQIVARRETGATRLQGLEFLNGDALWTRMRRGAHRLLERKWNAPDELVQYLYVSMLSREPSREELAAARAALGSPISESGAQDLLWSLAMLPEFNLAR